MTFRRSLGTVGLFLGLGGTPALAQEPVMSEPAADALPFYTTAQQPPPAQPRPGVSPPRVTPPPAGQLPPRTLPPAPQPLPGATPTVPLQTAPVTDVVARTPRAATTAGSTYNWHMLGDLLAGSYARVNLPVTIPVPLLIPGPPSPIGQPTPPRVVFVNRTVPLPIALQPIVTRGAFKISDNESPRPVDRVFVTYNYFNDAKVPTELGRRNFDVHREVLGFEKTFLDGDASVGLRLNLIQTTGAVNDDDFGDTTIVTKYALINNPSTGNVLSGGLVVTAPTGPRTILFNGQTIRSTLFQPWSGFIYNLNENFFTHGFSALVIPTNGDESLLATADVGLAWRAYQSVCCSDYFVSSVTPTIEAHYTAALNNDGFDTFRAVSFPTGVFILTTGVHFGLGCNAVLTTGLAVPLSGPKPFDLEAIAQVNVRF